MRRCEVNSSVYGYDPVPRCCEYVNELSGCKEGSEFLNSFAAVFSRRFVLHAVSYTS